MTRQTRTGNPSKSLKALIAAAIVLLVVAVALLVLWRRASASAHQLDGAPLKLESSSFADGSAIPRQFTCDGANASPELHWVSPPSGAKSLAIVMDDPDAPIDFTHWLAFDIPPGTTELAAGASPGSGMPPGSREGTNSFDHAGYGGPCPPAGKPHHYVFHLYAIDTQLGLPSSSDRQRFESAMSGHVLAEGRIVGIYQRTGE